jgi:hypothetical protein
MTGAAAMVGEWGTDGALVVSATLLIVCVLSSVFGISAGVWFFSFCGALGVSSLGVAGVG